MSTASYLPLAAWFEIPTVWVFIWAGLIVGTAAMIIMLRGRWRRIKPWQKCAILSLWVHVLLACLTTVVRIFSAAPGYGAGEGPGFAEGQAIRVAILPAVAAAMKDPESNELEAKAAVEDDAVEQVDEAAVVEQLTSELDEPETVADEPEPASELTAPLEAPTLLAQPPPVAPPTEATVYVDKDKPAAPTKSAAIESSMMALPVPAAPKPQAVATATNPSPMGTPTANAATGASNSARPAAFAARFATNRNQIVAGGGGNDRTERAVAAALAWLAAAQSPDGRWDAKRHGAGQERYVEGEGYILGQNRGGAGAKADTGVTGLALLAMLGSGSTHREGPYAVQVARGLTYLRKSQQSNGDLGGDAEFFARMYCHSMATFAAGEAYALTGDEGLGPLVRGGVRYSLAAQHPVDGGWRYMPGNTGDTSQLGWQLMALKSAELGGAAIPAVTWTRTERFLRQVERGLAGGLAAYRPEGPPTRTMTAEALYCRQLVTGRGDGGLSRAAFDEAVDSLLKELPSNERVNLYYWYYATLALHHAQHVSLAAGEAWRQWNDALMRTLVDIQQSDGSWSTDCVWGGYGGRVYTTALGAMCLEAYYRYALGNDAGGDDSGSGDGAGAADVAERDGWRSTAPR